MVLLCALLTASVLLPAAPGGLTDGDITALVRQALIDDARGQALSADALGRASNMRPDPDVARETQLVLQARLGERLTSLAVSCDGGRVTLRGNAADGLAQDRAGLLAEAVVGAREVDNQLVLPGGAPAAPPPRAEAAMPPAAPFAFFTTDGLAGSDVRVTVEQGVVHLTGTVNSPQARDYATATARLVPGTRLVLNAMTVQQLSRSTEKGVAQMIAKRFEWNPVVRPVAGALSVDFRQGVVRLEGRVQTAEQAAAAVELAASTEHVLVVDDRLMVPGRGEQR